VTKCHKKGLGVDFTLKSCDIIYGQPYSCFNYIMYNRIIKTKLFHVITKKNNVTVTIRPIYRLIADKQSYKISKKQFKIHINRSESSAQVYH